MPKHTMASGAFTAAIVKSIVATVAIFSFSSSAVAQLDSNSQPPPACNLSSEQLENPHAFIAVDKSFGVVAFWALKGKEGIQTAASYTQRDFAAQVFGKWAQDHSNKLKKGEPNRWGIVPDKKVEKALEKHKPLPLDRISEYPPREAMIMVTKIYGDCFGERSAELNFEEIGLIRGEFSADFCNAAAAMPKMTHYLAKDKALMHWGRSQIEHRNARGCGYVPAIAYEYALENDAAGREAAEKARKIAAAQRQQYLDSIRGQKLAKEAYEAGRAQREFYARQERDKQAAKDQARKQAADAAYRTMINNSQNQLPSAPSSNRRDCYDQGNGKEICFTD